MTSTQDELNHKKQLNGSNESTKCEKFDQTLAQLHQQHIQSTASKPELTQDIIAQLKQKHQNQTQLLKWQPWAALTCALLVAIISFDLIQLSTPNRPEQQIQASNIIVSLGSPVTNLDKPDFLKQLEAELNHNQRLSIAINHQLKANLETYSVQDQASQSIYSVVASLSKTQNGWQLTYCHQTQAKIYQNIAALQPKKVNWEELVTNKSVRVFMDESGKLLFVEKDNTSSC
ncbi:hypothetical protein [Catenovulum maritimum]|uniref:Uncharacterized protein n=1 Tax=Catenovulum maritimum TaxID=1513271 RepID=A0A0J8GW92_9ALTE|nr:hypothetical protein [Catenovulum maritimum]KMT64963.1 hypothetical protein XM47_11645 [Catenovulum maritimum]